MCGVIGGECLELLDENVRSYWRRMFVVTGGECLELLEENIWSYWRTVF
jgi:hypothetical protein